MKDAELKHAELIHAELEQKSDKELIMQSSSSDYSGDTQFQKLSPKQKLEWLFQAAEFVYKYKGIAR